MGTVDVRLAGARNTAVHLSVNTPVKVIMDDAMVGILHVSQNIPTRSNLDVSMKRPTSIQVHVSAVGPRFSSLSWKLDGDPEENEIDVGQRIPDKHSKLSCNPSCLKKGRSLEQQKSKKSG